jgi:hypothetical protein
MYKKVNTDKYHIRQTNKVTFVSNHHTMNAYNGHEDKVYILKFAAVQSFNQCQLHISAALLYLHTRKEKEQADGLLWKRQ